MSIKTVRHRLLYLKDGLQGTIFTALSNTRWLANLTPILAFLVRPLLGITLTTLALLQGWTFIHTAHKNIDGWLAAGSALGGALLNNVAAFGGFVARVMGGTFILAPWFFIAGFSVGAVYQGLMAALNACRAYESPANSAQRQHYIQTATYNLINAVQLTSCATAILLFNLFPAYTLLITGFALTVVAVNVGNCIWRFLSSDTKKTIKNALGFGKPEPECSPENTGTHEMSKESKSPREQNEPVHTSLLFTTCNHSDVIKNMDDTGRREYLSAYISNKLNTLGQRVKNEKNEQKIAVLELLKQVINENTHMPDKGKIHKKYPRVIDNFWCEKSDTDQLIDAVTYYVKSNHKHQTMEELQQVAAFK